MNITNGALIIDYLKVVMISVILIYHVTAILGDSYSGSTAHEIVKHIIRLLLLSMTLAAILEGWALPVLGRGTSGYSPC